MMKSFNVCTPENEKKSSSNVLTPTTVKMMKSFNVRTPENAKKKSSDVLTPTTCKMLRGLNVRTPETVKDNKVRRKLSICFDQKEEKLPSWKDIDHKHSKQRNKSSHVSNNANKKNQEVSDYERLIKATRCLPLPLKWSI